MNYDLFMVDYRGFGKSTGRISSQAQLQDDVMQAWRAAASRYAGPDANPPGNGVAGLRRVIYGRSLGTDLAAALAAQVHPDLTILVSPYWSMAEIARRQYPLLPIALLRYPLETYREVARMSQFISDGRGEPRGRLLLVHGERDTLIPLSHSQRLQALAPGAELVTIAGAGHGDLQDFPAYWAALASAIEGRSTGSSGPAAEPGDDARDARGARGAGDTPTRGAAAPDPEAAAAAVDLSAGKPSTARRRSPGT
jgi:pimeloyl-ACP methyl ester carboxylesterase